VVGWIALGALGIARIILLAVSLSSGGGSSRRATKAPTTSTTSVGEGLAAHDLQAASAASIPFGNAWSAYAAASTAATQAEKDAIQQGNTNAARAAEQPLADAVTTFINAVSTIDFPISMEADVRALLTAAGDYRGAVQQLITDPNNSTFNSHIDAINQANAVLNNAELLVHRDITQLLAGGSASGN
jgi:hypothetical protein